MIAILIVCFIISIAILYNLTGFLEMKSSRYEEKLIIADNKFPLPLKSITRDEAKKKKGKNIIKYRIVRRLTVRTLNSDELIAVLFIEEYHNHKWIRQFSSVAIDNEASYFKDHPTIPSYKQSAIQAYKTERIKKLFDDYISNRDKNKEYQLINEDEVMYNYQFFATYTYFPSIHQWRKVKLLKW